MTTPTQVIPAQSPSEPGSGPLSGPGMTATNRNIVWTLQKLATSIKWPQLHCEYPEQNGQLIQNLCNHIREDEILTEFHKFFPAYQLPPKNLAG